MTDNAWFDAVALAALVSLALQIVKPLVELLPGIGKSGDAHDALLRLILVALNLGGILLMAAAANALKFTPETVAQYAIVAGLQAVGGHEAYKGFIAGKVDASSAGGASVPTSPPGGAAG